MQVNAHAGSRTRVTSMGGLYDAATLRALTAFVKERMSRAERISHATCLAHGKKCLDMCGADSFLQRRDVVRNTLRHMVSYLSLLT